MPIHPRSERLLLACRPVARRVDAARVLLAGFAAHGPSYWYSGCLVCLSMPESRVLVPVG